MVGDISVDEGSISFTLTESMSDNVVCASCNTVFLSLKSPNSFLHLTRPGIALLTDLSPEFTASKERNMITEDPTFPPSIVD